MVDGRFLSRPIQADTMAPQVTPVRRSSWRFEIGITLLGILGLALFLTFYDRVFPSAAIDLALSRSEILQSADSYLQAQGYELQGYESALAFQQDSWGSIYLQQTVGVPETNRLVRADDLPIFYWHARWFRPLQKEEFSVFLSPAGEIVAFFHSVPEDATGADLAQDEARILAEDYLARDRGWTLADWEPIAASSEERPGGRTDHHFEWRRRSFAVGESELRLSVEITGDNLGSYNYWLKVPEAFQRHYMEQRNRASFFNDLSLNIGSFLFGLAAFGAYLVAAWQGVIPWKAGVVPALSVAVVSLLAGLNELPLQKIWYPTTQDYVLFWLERLFNLAFALAFTAASVLILWVGGQQLSKRVWRRQNKILPRGQDRLGTLALSGWHGLMLGGMMAGYLVLFYLVATQILGGWTPLDIPDSGLFATPFPFLAPLEVGLIPATTEELMYRLVGISLVLIAVRRRWLALLVPGALWGFAHLGYVRDPFYLRGLELTIVGVFLLGLFFLRFNLMTTIIAHFAYNAGLTALPLLRSSEPYFFLSGLIVLATIAAPVVPGAVRGLRRRVRGEKQDETAPTITSATAADLRGLAHLPIEGVDWAALLEDSGAAVLCLKADGEMIGACAGRVAPQGIGEVLAVYVAPEWRRQYWGSRLVDELCARLHELDVHIVQTTVKTGDQAAAAFWASQGWRSAVKVFSHSIVAHPRRGWRDLISRQR
jgi:GNAT superfamily N-acetyltransferase